MNNFISKHKTLILSVSLSMLIVWVYLRAIFVNFRILQSDHDIETLFAFLGICMLSLLLSKSVGFEGQYPILTRIIVILAGIGIIKSSNYIENLLRHKQSYYQIGYIYQKDKGSYNTKGYHPYEVELGINDTLKEWKVVDRKIFNMLSIGDTTILQVSSQKALYIKNLFPNHEIIERYKVPQHYINGELQEKTSYEQYSAAVRDSVLRHSHKQVGYVYEKTDDEYYRHLVKVGIDANHTTTHEFYETDRNYPKVYKRLHVGDTVILQVADSLPEINRVLCWQPDGNDIANYATYEAIKDYSNCSKEFETEKLLNSHNRKAIVYDKYEDGHVGAYLEVGIDEKHVRTYMFKTYSKEFKQIYQVVNVGDTVIAQVSDEIPQLNRVVNWQTATNGIEKEDIQEQITYVTVAKVKSKKTREEYLGRSYRKGTFYYVKLAISDKIETNYIKISSTRHRQIYESLHEGDSVLVKMTEGKTKTVSVLDWQPTPEEIEKYKTPVRLIEKNR